MIVEIIKILNQDEYYGAGNYVEIAKGKNELTYSFKDFRRKLKRQRLRNYVRKGN